MLTVPSRPQVHGSDLNSVYGPGDLTDFLVNFVTNLDPNGPTTLAWPKYDTSSVQLLTLLDGSIPQMITEDTYRKDAMEFLTTLAAAHPL